MKAAKQKPAKKKAAKKKAAKGRPGLTQGALDEAVAAIDREAISHIITAANAPGTEIEKEALLIDLIVTDPNLNPAAFFQVVFFMTAMVLKYKEMNGPQRQALVTDPRVIRAWYPHVRLAFPAMIKETFDLLLKGLLADDEVLLDSVYNRAGQIGFKPQKKKAATKKRSQKAKRVIRTRAK